MNDLWNRVNSLMILVVGKESRRHPADVIDRLFSLYKEVYPNSIERCKTCAGARARVYENLKRWWETNRPK